MAEVFTIDLSAVPTDELLEALHVLRDATLPSMFEDLYIELTSEIEHRVQRGLDALHVLSDLGIEPPHALIDLCAGLV